MPTVEIQRGSDDQGVIDVALLKDQLVHRRKMGFIHSIKKPPKHQLVYAISISNVIIYDAMLRMGTLQEGWHWH